MYNAHRGMGPPGQAPPGTRLAELLEQVRAEFETQAGRSNEHEHQRKHPADRIGAVEWWYGAAHTRAHSAGTYLALSAHAFAPFYHSAAIALDIMLTYLRA